MVTECEIERTVIRILSDFLECDSVSVEEGSRLVEDLYIDSMGLVEIVLLLNNDFCMELAESDIQAWVTVKDVFCSVKRTGKR
ncbi:phosphopantetheine-binding protein [Pseudomonas sp. RL_105y_Pfl2_101]|uniref:phosphopantetheine-binding protein n=1 Tax=Pseudomonas sp. RL_105y_Pfl2_101 TaxID=3088708 RepID=UPI00403F7FD2